jgi:hypothetical protein
MELYVHNEVLMLIDKSKQETKILWAASVLKTRLNVRLTLELENNISMASYGDGTNS